MQCLHSTLHPVGAERTPIPDHPETLLVLAKGKTPGISEQRIAATLDALPSDLSGYGRSAPPLIARPSLTCYKCWEEGHIARHCPNGDDDNVLDWVAF